MVDWYNCIKYIGTIALIIPILFLIQYPLTLILYIVGLISNIFLNYIVKCEERITSRYDKIHGISSKKYIKKHPHRGPFYEYNLYEYPSEKNQNISYAVGFMVTYLAQNRETIGKRDSRIVSTMILSFYLAIIIASIIIYLTKHNHMYSILAGHILGILMGVTFFKLSEPMLTFKTI